MPVNGLEPHLIESLGNTAREVFETMVFLSPSSIEPLDEQLSSFKDEVVGLLSFSGTASGTFIVRSRGDTATKIAARMLMIAPEELTDPAEMVDAFGEVVNMLGGNFKNVWVEDGNVMDLSVPCVIRGGEVNLREKLPGVRSGIRVVLGGEPVDIGVHFER